MRQLKCFGGGEGMTYGDPWEGACNETEKPALRASSFFITPLTKASFGRVVIKNAPCGAFLFDLAEEKGFEPLIPFRVYTLSRRAGSTTPALLRVRAAKIQSFGK